MQVIYANLRKCALLSGLTFQCRVQIVVRLFLKKAAECSLSLSLSLSPFLLHFRFFCGDTGGHRWPPTAQFTIKKQQETARHSKQIKKVLNLLQLFRLQQPVGLLNWIQVNQSLTASIWSNWIGNQLIYQLNYFTNSINLIWYFESNHFFSN